MPLDGLTLHTILNELNTELQNGRVMKIYQPDRYTIVLHLRLPGRNETLVLSADPVYPRIHTTTREWENPSSPPAFCMLLRKYLEPSRILKIEQQGFDRITCIHLEGQDHLGSISELRLILEVMGRQSNIILVNHDEIILDAIKRRSPVDGPVDRILMPGEEYQFPGDQGKQDPVKISADDFETELRLADPNLPVWKILQNAIQGLSRLAAEEIIFRAKLDPKVKRADITPSDWENIAAAFRELVSEVTAGGNASLVQYKQGDFAGYRVTHLPSEDHSNITKLVDSFYTKRTYNADLDKAKSELRRVLDRHLDRVIKKEGLQRQTIDDAKHAHTWRHLGELITANLHLIKKGSDTAEVVDYMDPDLSTVTIKLDPLLTPNENAQAMFKKYNKAKKSLDITQAQLEKTLAERVYLEETLTHIELAENLGTLREIKLELEREGYIKSRGTGKSKAKVTEFSKPERYTTPDGSIILVGRNNRQNDELTFKMASPHDLWFHTQNIPGSHVVLKTNGEPSDEAILAAAVLAARYSKAKTSPKVVVDYTQRRYVRKPSGARPGFVVYENFQSIVVDPGTLPPGLAKAK